MTELSRLADEELDSNLGELITNERDLLTAILHHLCEVERRRLFAKYGYSSLFDYAVKRFRYSEDQAYRRIAAMRLLKEIPAIEEKIESGALSLTNLTQAQKFFRSEKKANRAKSATEKLELLGKIENLSRREAEAIIAPPFEVGDGSKELTLRVSVLLQAKLERIKEVKAHVDPNPSLEQIIEMMADLALEKWDPVEQAKRSSVKKTAPVQKQCDTDSTYIHSATRHALYLRDNGQCGNCGSRRMIEIDHIVPRAMGGSSELENLRLLCRSCNQRHAIETYGARKMESFLREPSTSYRSVA